MRYRLLLFLLLGQSLLSAQEKYNAVVLEDIETLSLIHI